MRKYLVPLMALAFCIGCTTKNLIYDWGDYSSTLYNYKKDRDEETYKAHKNELLILITGSHQGNKRVPPGVYAEYGYYLLKEGKENDGMEYLDKEAATYPESVVFIQKLKAEYERGKK